MPKETEIEIIYSDLKRVIGEKYENMKGFKIVPMREVDIVDYLANFFLRNIDNMISLSDIITESELSAFKNDMEIIQMFNRIRNLKKE